jgi:hypothetical protein
MIDRTASDLSDTGIRQWVANLPEDFAFFKDLPKDVDLGALFQSAVNTNLGDEGYYEICNKMGPGGRLRLLSYLISNTDIDASALMIDMMIEGDGFSPDLKAEFNQFLHSLSPIVKSALAMDPNFFVAMNAALPMLSNLSELYLSNKSSQKNPSDTVTDGHDGAGENSQARLASQKVSNARAS